MKKNQKTINFLTGKLNALKKAKNSMTEEDAKACEQTIEEIQSLLDELKASEEEVTAAEGLQKTVELINEKIAALEEQVSENKAKGLKGIVATVKDFLASSNAVKAFANTIRNTAKGSNFRSNWLQALSANGITIASGSEEAYLPDMVKTIIADKWEDASNWLKLLNNTGAKALQIRYQGSDQDTSNTSAHGWARTPTAEQLAAGKSEQVLELAGKVLQAQYIYKLVPVDNITVWEDDVLLIKYVVDELFKQWRRAVCKAILVGGDATITNVECLTRSTGDDFVSVNEYDDTKSMVENVMAAIETVRIDDGAEVILFVNRHDVNELRKVVLGIGATPQYIGIDNLAESLGVTKIVTTTLMDSTTEGATRFIVLRPDYYSTVGSIEPQFSSQEDLRRNQQLYRVEVPFGGAVSGYGAAAVVTNPEED